MALFPALGGIVIGGPSWRNVWLLIAWALCYCFQFSAARWLAVRAHEVKTERKRRPKAQNSNNTNATNSMTKGSSNPTSSRVRQHPDRPNALHPDTNRTHAPHKARHSSIYLTATTVYLIAVAVIGIPLLVSTPKLLWWIPPYVVIAALSFLAAWRRSERTLWGNAVSVIAAGCMSLLATSLGSKFFIMTSAHESLGARLSPIGLHLASTSQHSSQFFLGSPLLPKAGAVAALGFILTEYASVVFVKTMFRQYGHSGYYALSVIYHAALAALGFAAPVLLQNFAGMALPHGVAETSLLWGIAATMLLLIAIVFPRLKRLKAMQVGGIEAFTSLMNLVIIAIALA